MHRGHTWSPVTLSVLDLQLDDARDADCENSLHAFGQSEKRSWVQCITIIPIRGISPRTRWYASLPINSSFQTQIRLCIKTSNQKVLQMFERWEWNLGKTHLLLFLEYIAESWNWFIVFASLCSLFQISISFYLGSSIFLTLFNLKSDENRIVSHDAIFYVHDATSKLSVISSWNKHMGILFAHARDEWNILSSTPLLVFERAPVGFQTGDLRCDKDLVKRDERL